MDSRPSVRPSPAEATPPERAVAPDLADAPPGALARLGQLLPGVEAVVGVAYRLAGVSAVAAALIVAAVVDVAPGLATGAVVALALLLLVPAAALALAGWTLADLASLPGQIKEAALAATGRASGGAPEKGSRIARLVRSLWAARGLAMLTKGGWVRAVGTLRFLRLASLPFALALLGAVALNAVVIVGGLVALLVLLF